MPNIKSAAKRVKVSETKTKQNKMAKTGLKTVLKNFSESLTSNPADAAAALQVAVKKVDKAAANGILHKNTAARKKSAMARAVNTVKNA